MTDLVHQPLPWILLGAALLGGGGWLATWIRLRRLGRLSVDRERELLRLEGLLNQARRMEAVGILAGSIVHNLNNLLAVILGHTRMALHEVPAGGSLREDLDQVAKAGNMATELVKDISDFYRQADQARKPLDLTPVVRDTLKLLRDILPPNVEIRDDLEPGCGPVLATASGVQQILMNLCSNSVQAMYRHQGLIEVQLRQEKIEGRRRAVPQELGPGTYVKLTVRDNGRGMDPDTLDHIFDSYFSKAPGGKMGIGLSTVTRILEDHDGATIPRSRTGQGTSFDLYFPLIAWKIEADSPPPPPPGPALRVLAGSPGAPPVPRDAELPAAVPAGAAGGAPRATILLVDDEEMVAQVTARGLRRLGFRVIMHTDCRKALSDFVQTPEIFDVVITDQIMPHMSGVKLTRKIHAVRPRIPVLLITGFRDSFNEQQAREAGVSDFVLKPTSHRDLAELVERVMQRRDAARG